MTSAALLIAAIGASLTRADDPATSPYAVTLRQHGIEPRAAWLSEYLRRLHPDERQRREVRRLIARLGSERFDEREFATTRLIALSIPPTAALRVAAEHHDSEVRWRANNILVAVRPHRSARSVLMFAVFKTIEREKIPGLTAELLRAMPLCDQRHLRLAARAAVRATARPGDASLLREATQGDDKQVVIAAMGGLAAALGTRAAEDLRRLMEHNHEEISLAAARTLADQGDRTSLGRLVKLLSAKSLKVRVGAAGTLRQVSSTRHRYLAYDDVPKRKQAIGRWAAWVEGKGRTAKLRFPLKRVRIELGRTLISLAMQSRVIELDANGKQVWEKTGLRRPSASMGLTNGHRLISSYDGRYVVEFDEDGEEVWRKDELPGNPQSVRRLENGNTLISCGEGRKVVEIRPDGSTAWEITIAGEPVDARRLDNGRTLVTLLEGDRVVEVDLAGKVLWELKGLRRPGTAERLENGNTLVAELLGSRVTEWDRGGKIVWQQTGLPSAGSAQRLSNGNTLIAHGGNLREVDPQGKIIWQKQMHGANHVTRY